MKREEALKILRKDLLSNLVDYYSSEELQDAIDTIVSQPYLPSNLDEAAEEYSRRLDYYHYTGDDPSIAFKSGAEWMAGQGVSMVITDETEWAEVDKFVHSNCDGASVIQIRKKQ